MMPLRTIVLLQAALLLLLAPRLSLWLDEVLTLIGAGQPDMAALLGYVRTVPGGSPLAFLLPRWSMELFGNSEWAARLPSILASLAASVAMWKLAQFLRLRNAWIPVLLLAVLPLQLRYAVEARPYAIALSCTLWMTVIFLEQGSAMLYSALTVAAVLAQPYAAFVAISHLAYAFLEDRRKTSAPFIGLLAGAALLAPWYLYFRDDWTRVNQAQGIATWDWKAPLVFVHEIAGSGYIGAILLFAGASLALRRADRAFWACCIAIPLALALIGNVVFHYFFSVRQVIYVLPVLALLFAAGCEQLGRAGQALLAALLIASLYADVTWILKPREDWRAASDAAAIHVQAGACAEFIGDSTPLYEYFHPELRRHYCSGAEPRVVLGVTPYGAPRDYTAAAANLESRGLRKQAVQEFDGPRVEVFAQ